MAWKALRQFIRYESSAGMLLFFEAVLALVLSNSSHIAHYRYLVELPISIRVDMFHLSKPLLLWVNDGLMAVFFLLVGLEVKREMLRGELNSVRKALLPGIAAFGGMLVPALIFLLLTHHHPGYRAGWAIPTATDIAFSLSVLVLLGKRLPPGIKIFLTALAIFDDIGAILIIALFYTSQITLLMLLIAFACIVVLFALNRLRVMAVFPYLLVGVILWVCVLKSGVHATLAGIVLAWAIPIDGKTKEEPGPLERWEKKLHPWVAYFILPLFAFVNAGLYLGNLSVHDLFSPLVLGCVLGLFVGKPLGIWGLSMLAVKSGIAKLPHGLSGHSIFGLSLIAGIGFTMSLFIGSLAFFNAHSGLYTDVQLGVFVGSLISGVAGYLWLKWVSLPRRKLALGNKEA